MYFGSVLLLLLIFPLASIAAEAIRFGHSITGIAALQNLHIVPGPLGRRGQMSLLSSNVFVPILPVKFVARIHAAEPHAFHHNSQRVEREAGWSHP
jgi:hypothetical protein